MSARPPDMSKTNVERLKSAIDEMVELHGRPAIHSDAVLDKIDVLERALERLRYELHYPENRMRLDEFIQGELFSDLGRIVYQYPTEYGNLGAGTSPKQLQPPLLLYLLSGAKRDRPVLEIVRDFIEHERGELSVLDFQKTQTGVTRCHTNTRFAANTLRAYGLLKFTRREAYKTWVLSLAGFVVASVVANDRTDVNEDRPADSGFDLHPKIREAYRQIKTFDNLVTTLSRICKPNVEVFGTFKSVLEKAHTELARYFSIMSDPRLSTDERRKQCATCMERLSQLPEMDAFCEEFTCGVKIEALIKP